MANAKSACRLGVFDVYVDVSEHDADAFFEVQFASRIGYDAGTYLRTFVCANRRRGAA